MIEQNGEYRIIEKELGRLTRNISKRVIHVSSEHKLTTDEVVEVVAMAEHLDEMTDPEAIAGKIRLVQQNRPENTQYSCLYIALKDLVVDAIRSRVEFSPEYPAHLFLLVAAGTTASSAAINLGIVDGRVSFEREHSLEHPTIGDRRIVGVCADPPKARQWIKAAEEAMIKVYPELNMQRQAVNKKVVK